jgi:hypothetical protein
VPFLLISPDARAAAMGDAGGAMPNDVNAMHWNIAKIPFNEKKGAVGLSYTPWLRSLVPDISLSYLSFYSKYGDRGAFSGSLRYFSLGQINFTDNFGNSIGNFTPFTNVSPVISNSNYFDGSGDYLSIPNNTAFKFGLDSEIDLYLNPDKNVPSAFSAIPLMMVMLSLVFYWTPSCSESPLNSEGFVILKILSGSLSGTYS